VSVNELIQQVSALSQRERALFNQLFRSLASDSSSPRPANPAIWPDFGERLRGIYGDKTVPDSQSIIDEGRGDR